MPKRREQVKETCCGSCFRCLITLAVLAIILAAGIYAAVYFTDAEKPSDLLNATFYPGNDWIPTIEDFVEEDPFNATTPEQANRWQGSTDGQGGLTLEIVNALEEPWFPFLNQAVQEWENGNPDVLSLTVTLHATGPDPDCSAIRGKMKVCNNNYGSTGWKGLNVVELLGDEIISSAAKMNEYYLASEYLYAIGLLFACAFSQCVCDDGIFVCCEKCHGLASQMLRHFLSALCRL